MVWLVLVFVATTGCDRGGESGLYRPGDNAPARAGGTGELRTVAEVFPSSGYQGLVVNNCATCHAAACAALGQRTPAQWAAVEKSHEYYIPGLSKEDHGKIFDYLRNNFNDSLPEPAVPQQLLEGGCPRL